MFMMKLSTRDATGLETNPIAENEIGCTKYTGCSLNIVFFPKILNVSDYGLSLFSLGICVCTHIRQVEHQRCSRTSRV